MKIEYLKQLGQLFKLYKVFNRPENKCGLIPILSFCPLLFLISCATFKPSSINEIRFWERSQSKYDDEIRVSVAVPSAEENQVLFGTDINKKEIQPIWVKVENHSDLTYYLVISGVDRNHFSPIEAAYAVKKNFSANSKEKLIKYFRAMNFRNPIPPHTSVSGFIFTNRDEGEKVIQVDLVANQQFKTFTFFSQIPGMRTDYLMVDFNSLYPTQDVIELDKEELKTALENLPCCTTNVDGTAFGDPLNLIIIGEFQHAAATFVRQGWLLAEETYSTAIWKTIKSFFFGSFYKYAPISSLYYDGRHQDFARQKPRHDIHERNHLRLWYTPMRFEGKPVFVGQISRDIGVDFTTKVWPPVTHIIDPDIDEARNSVIEDMLFSQTLGKFGFVKGVGRATPSKPKKNLNGDHYFTDGLRAVLFLTSGPISLDHLVSLDWEKPETFGINFFE